MGLGKHLLRIRSPEREIGPVGVADAAGGRLPLARRGHDLRALAGGEPVRWHIVGDCLVLVGIDDVRFVPDPDERGGMDAAKRGVPSGAGVSTPQSLSH